MSLNIAISNKQTLQVSALAYSERGIDLIHREVLNCLLPKYDVDKKYQFFDFDALYGALVNEKEWLSLS